MTDSLIHNRSYLRQVLDFSGLQVGMIYPTDLDGFIDFGGKTFIFIEAKHTGAQLPIGQRLAIERLCDACAKGGVDTIAFIVSHDTIGDVDLSQTTVSAYRYLGVWTEMSHIVKLRDAISGFREKAQKRRMNDHLAE